MKFELNTLEEYTDEALLAELRRVAGIVKSPKLSISQFSAIAKVHGSTLQRRFGGWRKALERAGLSDRIDSSNIRSTDEEVLKAIAKAAREMNKTTLTLEEFEAHTVCPARRYAGILAHGKKL